MKQIASLLFFIIIGLSACTDPPPSASTSTPQSTPQTAPSTPETPQQTGPVVRADAYLPSITMEEMTHLWNTCNQMDYIFYELPISSSLSDQSSAQAHLRHVSDTPVGLKEKERCGKAIGRIFYKVDGTDLFDAEVYFSGGCAFYVFFKDGKRTYSNLMTPSGVDHFNQIIAAATKGPSRQ